MGFCSVVIHRAFSPNSTKLSPTLTIPRTEPHHSRLPFEFGIAGQKRQFQKKYMLFQEKTILI
jgi:hypothetical protein